MFFRFGKNCCDDGADEGAESVEKIVETGEEDVLGSWIQKRDSDETYHGRHVRGHYCSNVGNGGTSAKADASGMTKILVF